MRRPLLSAALLYAALTLLLNLPVVLDITRGIPHDDQDPVLNSWILRWDASHLPIAGTLAERGWQPIFASPVSRVFARAGRGPFVAVTGPAPAPRCFPGP